MKRRSIQGKEISVETVVFKNMEITEEEKTQETTVEKRTKETTEEKQPKSTDRPAPMNQTISSKLKDLKSEVESLREQRGCKICLENEASILFLPCGHLCSCPNCAPALKVRFKNQQTHRKCLIFSSLELCSVPRTYQGADQDLLSLKRIYLIIGTYFCQAQPKL